MIDQNDYFLTIKPLNNIVVKSIEFLTPAKITLESNGIEKTEIISIDIINRKAYDQTGDDTLSDIVFRYLDGVTLVPDDFYAAPHEIIDQANQAKDSLDSIQKETLGDNNV